MCYTHLTTTERVKIETYQELGMSIRSIARRLGRQPSTVSREIRRNPDYVAERAETRGRINVGLPISKRPPEVRGRRTFGHWKLDTVVSGRGKSKACVATFIERKSRFYLALPIADRTAASMEGAIHAVHGAFPEGTFETATTDRGKEFSGHERIQASLGVPMYFAVPRSVPGTRSHAASRRSSGASCRRVSSWRHSWSSPSRSVSGQVQPHSRGSV